MKQRIIKRWCLRNKIDNDFLDQRRKLVMEFKHIESIGLTCDIWSTPKRSFLGVTAHWIDSKTLKHKCAVLSCERFLSPHTNERIAEQLQLVCSTFGVNGKVIATTTDNASNFLKAFRVFGITFDSIKYDDETNEFDGNAECEFLDIDLTMSLSAHISCSCHTFNLIASKDSAAALDDVKYSRIHTSAFNKMNRLWNCTNRYAKAEKIKKILGHSIYRPIITRWNSLQVQINNLNKIDPNQLNEVMEELDLRKFTDIDLAFMKEFVKVTSPIANAIDYMQSNCHFGLLLPTMYGTKWELNDLDNESIEFCGPLIRAIRKGFDDRFDFYFDFDDVRSMPAIVATCMHPYFKLRWLPNSTNKDQQKQKIKTILIEAAKNISICTVENKKNTASNTQNDPVNSENEGKLRKNHPFRFHEDDHDQRSSQLLIEEEMLSFLRKPCSEDINDLTQLNDAPNVLKLFMKYGCICTSSAPSERLFSFASNFACIYENVAKPSQLGQIVCGPKTVIQLWRSCVNSLFIVSCQYGYRDCWLCSYLNIFI